MQDSSIDDRRCEVIDRSDLPRGLLNTAWPVVALALLLLALLRSCMH